MSTTLKHFDLFGNKSGSMVDYSALKPPVEPSPDSSVMLLCRAVCVHDQAQWDETWKEALNDFSSSRRGLMLPTTFFEVLRANSVPLSRSEARVLLWQFQEPNGAVSVTKFLQWVALNAPADHVNPDLLFPQLPQPYRRIMKVWERDIFDAAWEIITTDSVRFKAENAKADAAMNSSRSALGTDKPQHQKNDYDIAKRRACEPSWQLPLDNSAQQVAGLASHCLLSIVVAGINYDAGADEFTSTAPALRVLSTADEDVELLGDIPVEFHAETPAGATDTVTKVHVSIKSLSPLQLVNDNSGLQNCAIAVHLLETTTITPVQLEEPDGGVKPAAPTIRECVNVYTIRKEHSLDPNASGGDKRRLSSELLASLGLTQASVEPSIVSIVLSPDSLILAVVSVGSKLISFYSLQHEEIHRDTEEPAQPLMLSSPAFQVDLEPTRSPFLEDELEPTLHFLVAPVTTRDQNRELSRSTPSTYAFAVCCGLKVLKYLLPHKTTASTSSAPVLLTPVKSWEHLTKLTASAQDITTQYLVVGCKDGTTVVWDVLQDVDYAFLAPLGEGDSTVERATPRQKPSTAATSTEISHVIFCQARYVVALSKSQQRLFLFDLRERGKPKLLRAVSAPEMKSSKTRQTPQQPTVSMVRLAVTTVAADIPVALIEYSNGIVVLYDVRTAEAVGSFWSNSSPATTSSLRGVISIIGNQEVLGVAVAPSEGEAEMCINVYCWRDILLASFPSVATLIEQRQEEPTISNIKQLLHTSDVDDFSSPPPPSTITVPSTSADALETMLLKMAGELPPSTSRTRQSNAGGLSSLQSPLARSSVSIASSNAALPGQYTEAINPSPMAPVLVLEPLVPDDKAFFEQYCREYLDPLVIADKEAKLHRKRRELLKTMSAGGAW